MKTVSGWWMPGFFSSRETESEADFTIDGKTAVDRYRRCGFVGALRKPVQVEAFKRFVARLLDDAAGPSRQTPLAAWSRDGLPVVG